MKIWNKPELWILNADRTEAGSKGKHSDGVWLENHDGEIMIGTSGKTPGGWTPISSGSGN